MRKGPNSQQQNRCTEQQTALSCCERFPLILGVKCQTCTHTTETQKSQDIVLDKLSLTFHQVSKCLHLFM